MTLPVLKVAMLAAHGGSNSNLVPLGGGAAVCERLVEAWRNVSDLELTLIVPGSIDGSNESVTDQPTPSATSPNETSYNAALPEPIGKKTKIMKDPGAAPMINKNSQNIGQLSENPNNTQNSPASVRTQAQPEAQEQAQAEDTNSHPSRFKLLRIPVLRAGERPCDLSEFRYAKFSRQFEKLATKKILELKPHVVLTHDISEGPNFKVLKANHIPCIPIFHVDVVDFFCRMYLGGRWSPKKCEHFWAKLRPYPIVPDILRLVFDKQADAVRTCPKLIVPSEGMKQVLLDTYGDKIKDLSERIEVIPWGAPVPRFTASQVIDAIPQINSEFNLNANDPVIVTLSRISPEKAQNKLLEALLWAEQVGKLPAHLTVFICGSASYMQGPRFFKKLRSMTEKLHKVRVIYPGHVGDLRKAALLARADVFVSTSCHESYGLTTMEAMQAGTPVVALDTPGARQTIKPHTGIIVENDIHPGPELWQAIHNILNNPDYKQILSDHARLWAQRETFLEAAQHILDLLDDQGSR
ncbi:MAG: glycosyltransferase family 4 protein [bacterium]|nr:glycosyltransferase family 4 protein [bacterium]